MTRWCEHIFFFFFLTERLARETIILDIQAGAGTRNLGIISSSSSSSSRFLHALSRGLPGLKKKKKSTHRSALPSAGHFVDGRCSVVCWGSSLTVTGKGIMRGKSKHKYLL